MERNSVCYSDHFPVRGHVRQKNTETEVIQFKKANWDRLNLDLHIVGWDIVIN